MHAIKDFATLFGVAPCTIHRKLRNLKPVLKNFGQIDRKRLYTDSEAEFVISELKKVLKRKVKEQPKSLESIYNSEQTTA